MMKKIYVYGTGSKALKFLPALALKYEIVGFLDSDASRSGQSILGKQVFHPSSISSVEHDEIVIASSYISDITEIIAQCGLIKGIPVEELPEIIKLAGDFSGLENHYRQVSSIKLPKISLQQKNIEEACLITNRLELLELLPKGGVTAEMGVANGDYTSQILSLNQPEKLHLIDIWESERYNETLFNNVRRKFCSELASNKVQIHRNFSTKAVEDFNDGYFDWIYIDTTHCYEGTKAELELFASKMKPGGIIAGHDYTMGNWDSQFRYGVMEAVHEFCVTYGWRIKYLTMDLSEGQSFAICKI